MEQTYRISEGSKQEAETTLARMTENKALCEDKSIRRPGGVMWRPGLEEFLPEHTKLAYQPCSQECEESGAPLPNNQVQTH